MDTKNIIERRQQMVVKSNTLIQDARYNLSLEQQRILLYLISKIDPRAAELEPVTLSILEFCEIAGIEGKKYSSIKSEIKKLADLSFWIEEDGTQKLKRWISSEREPQITRGSGIITLRLSDSLKKYLLQLREQFTQYQLEWILAFKRKYSIRLYEYICSRHFDTLHTYFFTISVDELRAILGAEKYERFSHFNERVLIPAFEEINLYSDKSIVCTPQKNGKKVFALQFEINHKDALQCIEIDNIIQKKLGIPAEQMTLFDELQKKRN